MERLFNPLHIHV